MSRPRLRRPFRFSLSMRAKAGLLAALMVSLPLAFGAVLVVSYWRETLLETAMVRSDVGISGLQIGGGATLESCAESVARGSALLPPHTRQYCLAGLADARPEGESHPGTLKLALWPDFLEGPVQRPLRIVTPGVEDMAPLRLLTVNTLDAEQAELAAMERWTVGIAVGLTLLAGFCTWYAAGRALRPMEAIRLRFTELSAHRLDQRVPVPAGDNEISRLARTMNDSLARLEDSVERQRRFSSDASHELRTPLAALRAELEIALAQPQNADWPRVVERALGDTMRLQRLTEDLLMLTRLGAQETLVDSGEPLDLVVLAREECGRRRPPERLRLTVSGSAGPAPVRGHTQLLGRVLGNLLDNAERYADARIAVVVHGDPGAGTVLLEVADDGPGIPPADRTRVFHCFTRLDDARSYDTGGTGLGLAIAHHITTLHHGTLTVGDSARGARFVVTLPRLDTAEEEPG
ncbi:sensor histidine kinase [Streptomyces yaizuensis]|uniref:histidine kinase n=1 Tax=Streptomyces yaizuensis TaxID=2989713 RepID=A0ABQ5P426_9ACTN|nr:ATP-binding protein [Streptomyces sp. YSPA8]GLF97335.1 HAMP domain-containing histidine kinase [Streptomyces sp. YSPA8]